MVFAYFDIDFDDAVVFILVSALPYKDFKFAAFDWQTGIFGRSYFFISYFLF